MTLRPEFIDFQDIWNRFKHTLENVINLRPVSHVEWTERFSDLYKMCVAVPENMCDRLYNETKIFIELHVQSLYLKVGSTPSNKLLKTYYEHWINYKKGIDYLNNLYLYLNIQYIRKQKFTEADLFYGNYDLIEQKLEVRELGLFYWEQEMVWKLADRLTHLILEAINDDRIGRRTNESVIYEIVHSLVAVESYKKHTEVYGRILEKPFLEATGNYYRIEAERLREGSTCSEYMERVLQRIQSEKVRLTKFLHSSSFETIIRECENRMIAEHIDFLHGECHDMVINERRKDLKNMFSLLRNVKNGLNILVREVQDHITKNCLDVVVIYLGGGNDRNESNMPSTSAQIQPKPVVSAVDLRDHPLLFVEQILSVHKRFSDLIETVFDNDQLFKRALDNAFSTVINHRRSTRHAPRSPELLSRYCDHYLKKSASKGLTESEIDDKLCASITVFKYIDDKDVFQKFYSKMLCKRLIHSQSVSMDCEESLINRLKQACGHEFTMKLHRMFTDIKVSEDMSRRFLSWCSESPEERKLGPINFSIFVLQAGAWPLTPSSTSTFEIPLPLEKCVSNFEKYYYTRFNGRRLTWLHSLGTTDVRITFPKKSYLVTMGTFFMAILLLFENTVTTTFAAIQQATKLTDDVLLRHLIVLIDTKLLLTDQPLSTEQKPQEPEMKISFNLNYSNKRTRFKITALPQKEVQQQQIESDQTHASVEEDRKLYLQAAIVRIMKARRLIKHNQLIQEVIALSKGRFNPSIQMIKKCVEALIEKQYVERTSANADEYSYIA